MSQERMHPEDVRREMAMRVWDSYSTDTGVKPDIRWAVEIADAILAELARTEKPEAEPIRTLKQELRGMTEKAEKAEARVKELGDAIRNHERICREADYRVRDIDLWKVLK